MVFSPASRTSPVSRTSSAARRGRIALAAVLLAVLTAPGLAAAAAAAAAPSVASAADVQSLTLGGPGMPFGFVQPLDPLVTLGDSGDEQLALITPLASVPASALTKTTWVNLGQPGVDKEFLSFIWNADSDRAAQYIVSYSVDGRAWLSAVGKGGFDLPDGSHGKTIAIRVWMTTSDANATPRFDDLTIEWTKWKGKPTKPTGDASGVSHKPNAGHNNGSGAYTYPSAQQPAAQASAQSSGGTGASTGTGGSSTGGSSTGGGSATPTGGGGSGASVSQATVTEPVPEVAPVPPVSEVPAPPVESTGEGAPTAVTGVVATEEEQQVSGVPYVPSGGTGSAGSGGTPPGGVSGGLGVPVLLIAGVTVVLGATLYVPWLVTAASLREITGFSPRRARTHGPFRSIKR